MFQPLSSDCAVDDAVIARERDAHHVDRLVRTFGLAGRNDLLGSAADGQDTGLRRVDDGGEVRYAEHAQVGDGDGAAHELVRQKFSFFCSSGHLSDVG